MNYENHSINHFNDSGFKERKIVLTTGIIFFLIYALFRLIYYVIVLLNEFLTYKKTITIFISITSIISNYLDYIALTILIIGFILLLKYFSKTEQILFLVIVALFCLAMVTKITITIITNVI
ncbi:hypothetical protein EU523_00625, partial [Candidatus Heimdallarchaeota archaeon]